MGRGDRLKTMEAIDRLYYMLTLHELRQMHRNTYYANITYNSMLYMDLIHYTSPCTVSTLADALHITKSAVTLKVADLIKQGLVVKTQSDKDRRVYYLCLSPAAAHMYKQYDARLTRAIGRLEGQYRQAEIETFCQMLEQLSADYMEEPG